MSTSNKPSDKYIFNIDDYEIIRTINKGGFGVVNLVRHKRTNDKYAAKTNLIQNAMQNKKLVLREARILIQVQHPTIIQFRGLSYVDFHGDKNITIFMDFKKEGSLADLINKEMKSLCPTNYDNTKRQIILVGVARGMMILHKKFVIHRDLKPENILIDEDFRPVITDFGLSKFFDPHHSTNQSMTDSGTWQYMAPEVILSDRFNTKADVYAFGILMYEVLAGRRAYSEFLHGKKKQTVFQMKMRIKEGLRPDFNFPIKKSMRKMIEKCWAKNPKERPTFQEIYKKLSLSSDDFWMEFEDDPIIDDDDDDEEEEENAEDEELAFISKKYCLDNVDTTELLDYVDEIESEPASNDRNETIQSKKKEESNNKKLLKKIDEMSEKIKSLEKELKKVKNKQIESIYQIFGNFFSCEMSLKSPGILCTLKNKEKNHFEKLFIASQSSNDIYSIIDPNTKDKFCSSNQEDDFIQFELEKSIKINGIKIFTSNHLFPKSFDISIEGKIVKSIKEANDLNGEYKEMIIKFTPIQASNIKIIKTGPNWDSDNNFVNIKRVELLSPESKYSNGVFTTLIKESENNDPHKCPVFITASHFDLNTFHSIKSNLNTWIYDFKNSWFQVELTKGIAIIKGFRLNRYRDYKMKSYKLICTDDSNKPVDSWTTLIEINEKTEDEHNILDIYEFQNPSPPTRFIRIIMTGPTWNNNLFLSFFHFDFFGCYF